VADAWRVIVDVPRDDAELAADALWQLGALGIEERNGDGDRVLLLAGMVDHAAAVHAAAAVGGSVDHVVDDAWADEWRRFAKPVLVGSVLVQPAWLPVDLPTAAAVVVRIDPERVFGSGAHASTRLALAALIDCLHPGQRMLDVGCGSGVLSVVAACVHGTECVALDLDPAAVDVTVANARRNGVEHLVHATTAPLRDLEETFDVVVANVLPSVSRELAGLLTPRVVPDGTLVVSGLLEEHIDELASMYEMLGFTTQATPRDEGWAAIALRRDRDA
jgi:ribosomal protein L11 methyltransferase